MKRTVYLGLRPKDPSHIHFPVIAVDPVPFDKGIYDSIDQADWIIFTSQSTIEFLKPLLTPSMSAGKVIFSIGDVTALTLRKQGIRCDFIPKEETQEGLIEILKTLPLRNKRIFCGRSNLSRPSLKEFLKDKDCIFDDPILYTTKIAFDLKMRPSLSDGDEVMFTSPSTVDGFMAAYEGEVIPKNLILKPIGPVTKKKIEELF